MPRIHVYCKPEDYLILEPLKNQLHYWWATASAAALGLDEIDGVDLMIHPVAMVGSFRLEMECFVSRGKTPKQNKNEWSRRLDEIRANMLNDTALLPAHHILASKIGIWSIVEDGQYRIGEELVIAKV